MKITPPPMQDSVLDPTPQELVAALNAYIAAHPSSRKAEIYNRDVVLLHEVGKEFKEAGYTYHVPNVPTYGDKYKLTIKW